MRKHNWKDFVKENEELVELDDEEAEQVDKLLQEYPITDRDLEYFRMRILEVIHGQSPLQVFFGKNEGSNIAFVLLCEIRRLKEKQREIGNSTPRFNQAKEVLKGLREVENRLSDREFYKELTHRIGHSLGVRVKRNASYRDFLHDCKAFDFFHRIKHSKDDECLSILGDQYSWVAGFQRITVEAFLGIPNVVLAQYIDQAQPTDIGDGKELINKELQRLREYDNQREEG